MRSVAPFWHFAGEARILRARAEPYLACDGAEGARRPHAIFWVEHETQRVEGEALGRGGRSEAEPPDAEGARGNHCRVRSAVLGNRKEKEDGRLLL